MKKRISPSLNRQFCRFSVVLFALVSVAAPAFGDTLTWTASGGGNWSDANNWSSDGSHAIPQSGDTIKINTLKSGETYNNDIVGLSTPHLEFGGQSASAYPMLTGNQITLTGGMNAFSSASGRFNCYIPLVLTVQDGNPTNRFYCHGGRLQQYGKVTGAGLLFKDGKSIMELCGGNEHTGGTVNGGTLGGWLDPYAISSGDNAGNTPCGSLASVYTISGKTLSRFSINTFPHNTDIRPASNKSATETDFWFYSGIKNFTGNITGERLVVDLDTGTSPTFSGSITLDTGLRFTFTKVTAGTSKHSATISGAVSCSALNDYVAAPASPPAVANLTLTHADNSIGAIYANVWNLHAGAKNAFGNGATVYLGQRVNGFGTFDLGGYDQRIDRFVEDFRYPGDGTVADMVGHVVTSVGGAARLTMAATDDCTTDAQFDGEVTLVWDPQGSYSFSTALPGRMMGTTGGIVVSNGTFTVNGTNSFDSATSIEVADGASFAWASAKPFGLRFLTSLTLGAGASFAVQSGAAFPFTTNVFRGVLSLNLASGSSLSLPSGTVLPAVSVTADGVDYPVGTILSGDTGVEGTIYLPQLGAGVKVKVVEALSPVSTISTLAYVQDGLLCHLDGIENAGRGVNDNASKKWKDLSGVVGDFDVTNNVEWTGSGLRKKGNGFIAIARNAKRSDIKTMEAAMSGLDKASANTVMPIYNSNDRYFVIQDSASSRKIWRGDGNCWETALKSAEATIAATYTSPIATYQNGVVPDGASSDYNTWSPNNNPANSISIGGRAITWASADVSTYGYTVNALRMYNRALTAEEIRQNYEVDSIRFHGIVPEGCTRYRVDPADQEMLDCRLDAVMTGGGISVDGGAAASSVLAWPVLGDRVVLSALCDARHSFVGWSGDTNAIIGGTVESSVVTVRVDRALSFAAVTSGNLLVVTEDTCLTENVGCRGIRFTGPWTLSAAAGVSVQLEEFGEGITIDEGTSGNVVISCPLVAGVLAAGDEQRIVVPAGATLEISGAVSGLAPLRASGAGTLKLTGGGDYAGDLAVDTPQLRMEGVYSSADGMITISPTSILYLAGADVGKLVRSDVTGKTFVSCEDGTVNYLNGGWRQLPKPSTAQPTFSVPSNAELTFGGVFNDGGVSGVYVNLSGNGKMYVRATTQNNIGCINMNMGELHVWNQIFASRPYYCTLGSSSKAYLHVENAVSRMPWKIQGYVDLCGHNQTMGRMSYVSEGSGSSWKPYTTGVIHSDTPATLTIYHDDNASGGGNHGPQVFGGKFTGAASLVKTGANGDLSMSTNHLILAGTSTSTGSVAVTWGLLSFTNSFTLGSSQYLGTWPGCASATASEKGILELCHSKALGRCTDVYVGTGGKIRLSAGVNQRVRFLYLPTGEEGAYVRQRIGRYGSSQSSAPAGNQFDAYFEGSGTLTSAGEFDGSLLIFK
jgi:hypothetical protein